MAFSLLVAGQSAASIPWKPSRDMGEGDLLFLTPEGFRYFNLVGDKIYSFGGCGNLFRFPHFLRRCSIFSTSASVFEGFAGDTESLITSGRFFQLGV